ncbi:MAG: MerR family transcriptional regulator [Betaproteobacteria bacterium]|nr:MerR family transcriptional regulator [Betaproteobacteria bacterium]
MNLTVYSGILLEEAALSSDELAHACGVSVEWVHVQVSAGALPAQGESTGQWRFTSRELKRARRLRELERAYDAAPELAGLVVDLQDEIASLRRRR